MNTQNQNVNPAWVDSSSNVKTNHQQHNRDEPTASTKPKLAKIETRPLDFVRYDGNITIYSMINIHRRPVVKVPDANNKRMCIVKNVMYICVLQRKKTVLQSFMENQKTLKIAKATTIHKCQ